MSWSFDESSIESSIFESSTDDSSIDESSIDESLELFCTRQHIELRKIVLGGVPIDVLRILQDKPYESSLTKLYINCELSFGSATLISNALNVSESIIALKSGENVICCDGIIAIVEAFSNNSNATLRKLVIDGNKINSSAAVAISHLLKTNRTLAKLNISYCNIDSEGAIIIGDALK